MGVATHYALSHDANIAYQVRGEGEVDLVFVPNLFSNIDLSVEFEAFGTFTARLASFSRLIYFDRRGNGMSGGAAGAAPLEQQLDDVRAVLDAAGSRAPALLSEQEGAALALLFAATYPDSVRALVLMAPQARLVRGEGYEWGLSAEQRAEVNRAVVAQWGNGSQSNPWAAGLRIRPGELELLGRYQRLSVSPGEALAVMRLAGETDVRDVLASVQCPTLVLRRRDDAFIDERHSRYAAEHIPGLATCNCPAPASCGTRTPTALPARSPSSSAARRRRRRASACSRRSCSATSSARRSAPASSETPAGACCSSATTR